MNLFDVLGQLLRLKFEQKCTKKCSKSNFKRMHLKSYMFKQDLAFHYIVIRLDLFGGWPSWFSSLGAVFVSSCSTSVHVCVLLLRPLLVAVSSLCG